MPIPKPRTNNKKRLYTQQELDTIRTMFPDHYTMDIAKLINRSYDSVALQASRMGITKSKTFREQEYKRQGERIKIYGEKYRLKPGHIPHNKGVPMTQEMYEKIKHSFFKPGNVPYNKRENGYEYTDGEGYIRVRIGNSKYKLKHHIIWEQHHGPIPKGHIIVFRDKNSHNCAIENLEMITMAENMKRNQSKEYPQEIKETIKLINKLKKTIHAKEQN